MSTPLTTWTVTEHINLSWSNQVVTHAVHDVKIPEDTHLCVRDQTDQIHPAQYVENRLFYGTDLPAQTQHHFQLYTCTDNPSALTITEKSDTLLLQNQTFGITLSWTKNPVTYKSPQPLNTCPPPLKHIHTPDQQAFGTGIWQSEALCTGFRCEILYTGPVVTAVEQVYTLEQGDLSFTYQFDAVSPYVHINISGTQENMAAVWDFEDLKPTKAFWRPHSTDDWRGNKTKHNRQVYPISKTDPPDVITLQPFYNWHRNGAMFWSCTTQQNQALIIGATHPATTISHSTFHPHHIHNGHQLHIAIPNGQTAIAIGLLDNIQSFTNATQTQIETCYRNMHSLDLNTYAHMDLHWKNIENISFPRLFIAPQQKEQIQNKAKTWEWFHKAFTDHVHDELFWSNAQPDLKIEPSHKPLGRDLAGAYLASGDPTYAHQAFEDINQKLTTWVDELGALGPTVDALIGFAFANPFRATIIAFDLIADALSPEERVTCLKKIAFLTEIFFSTDAWPDLTSGLSRGNLNFHASVVSARGLAAALLDGHPKQKKWLAQTRQEAIDFLHQYHFESGCARESITYQFNVVAQFTQLSIALHRAGFEDLFETDPILKKSFTFLASVQTPKDSRVGFCMLPTVGHVTSYGWGQSLQACFAWAATATAHSDPTFSAQMTSAWQRAESPAISLHDFYHGQIWWPPLCLITRALKSHPEIQTSIHHNGLGAVFRSYKTNGYLLTKMGPSRGHYDPDEGSLLWYAWGQPMLADFGCQYNPNIECAHLHNRISFDQWNEANNPAFKIQAHHLTEHVDAISGTLTITHLHRWADRPIRETNFDFRALPPPKEIAPITWQRQVIYIKDCEAMLIHDKITGNQATNWNLQVFANSVQTHNTHAHCKGQFGVDLSVHLHTPHTCTWAISSFEHLGFDEPRLPAWWWRSAQWTAPPNTVYGPVGEHALTVSIPAEERTEYLALLIAHPSDQSAPTVARTPDGFTWQTQEGSWKASQQNTTWQISSTGKFNWTQEIPV